MSRDLIHEREMSMMEDAVRDRNRTCHESVIGAHEPVPRNFRIFNEVRSQAYRVRIAVSGSHCSGKTTLVEDFLRRHAEYTHEPEPYEWLTEASAELNAADVWQQLEISVERLSAHAPGSNVIAERAP